MRRAMSSGVTKRRLIEFVPVNASRSVKTRPTLWVGTNAHFERVTSFRQMTFRVVT